jgi:hypothetical protein
LQGETAAFPLIYRSIFAIMMIAILSAMFTLHSGHG